MTARPRLLDLFCGAGGAGAGYARAGFEVVGVDIDPQPRYPFRFVMGDALEYLAEHGREYDVIHASPPCQAYSSLRGRHGGNEYPDMVAATRAELAAVGRPWVIENVPGAPLADPLMLCGSMFGLRVIRHRLFESDQPLPFAPATCSHPRGAVGHRGHFGLGDWVTVTGHFSNVQKASAAMGIDWMTRDGLAQAIPPAYTAYIGAELARVIGASS